VSRGGREPCERPQGQDLRGVAEVAWLVQLGQEKPEGWPHGSVHLPQEGQQRERHLSPLSGDWQQDVRKWNEATLGEVQTGH